MKQFILVGVGFFVLGIIATIAVFLLIDRYFFSIDTTFLHGNVSDNINDEASPAFEEAKKKLEELDIPEAGIPLSTLEIGATQTKVLETAGIDTKTFTITKDMISCAESNIGTVRVAEIVAGDSPSALEIPQLLPCLK